MRIFISWSGEQSKRIAEAFRKWLPSVIQAAKPYYSPDDIAKGAKWGSEISKELETSKVGIICLNSENLVAPWIMFEAGALSKQLEQSKVCPILFGIEPSEIQGPLVQFQAARFSKEEIFKVLKTINNELPDNKLDSETLNRVFDMWWPLLNEEIEKIMTDSPDKKKVIRSERDILEEILSLQREASITSKRRRREIEVEPQAVTDLVEGYSESIGHILDLSISSDVIRLSNAVKKLHEPLLYLLHNTALEPERRRFLLGKFQDAAIMLEEIRERKIVDDEI